MRLKRKIIKFLIVSILILVLVCFAFGCGKGKSKSFYDEEYVLTIENGRIKCSNFDYVVCVEKKKGDDFKILNFTDIQLENYQITEEFGTATTALEIIGSVIEEVNPDLITLSGDQGYGEPVSINAIAKVINGYNIPWAYVFGNHDQECRELSMRQQVDLYASYSNCIGKYGPDELTKNGSTERAGNYIINIVEKDGDSINLVRSIFMFNSGSSSSEVVTSTQRINNCNYEHLNKEQLDFYKWALDSGKKYNNGEYAKSTIIEHIPITAYAFAFADAYDSEYSAYEFDKIVFSSKNISIADSSNGGCWKDGYKDSFGVCHEVVCSSPVDDGIFDILKEYGSTDSMLVGHDHINNFSINYQGIKLSYSTKTGMGCYGDGYMLGGTVLTVNGSGTSVEHIYRPIL